MVLFADGASSNKTIILPKPHDKIAHALDIIVKKYVVREDYGAKLYLKDISYTGEKDEQNSD